MKTGVDFIKINMT